MKKFIILILIIIVMTSCSNKEEVKVGKYTYDGPSLMDINDVDASSISSVTIEENNIIYFEVPAVLISYVPHGKYKVENGTLTFKDYYNYSWEIKGDVLIYTGDEIEAYNLKKGIKYKYSSKK